jgi:hypothetical protein
MHIDRILFAQTVAKAVTVGMSALRETQKLVRSRAAADTKLVLDQDYLSIASIQGIGGGARR